MFDELSMMFSKMIGTLAVILVVATFIGISDILPKFVKKENKWKFALFIGLLGGAFGIYGNISGFDLNGAVISIRDIGPMLAGCTGGPLGGLLAGLIAGVHRLTMGGITARACVVATCSIGLICGLITEKRRSPMEKPLMALLLSASMELLHLGIVLLMVRPFSTALDIVEKIAIPFVAVNSLGFVLMVIIMNYTERQRNLAMERNRLQSELEVARVIQHSLLPIINEDYPGRGDLEVAAFMEAAKEVGGDFYDLFYVDPNRLAFVIGDVSGKGIPAALFMASAKITLQSCIRDIPKLSEAMEAANNALCARNEADMFVTAWVGIFDLNSGALNFVCAGHNPPVLLRKGMARYLRLKSCFVLAGMEGMKYQEECLQLEPGDLLYLYTDGVTEAEDRSHQLFGEKRLLRCCEDSGDCSPGEMIDRVKDAIEGFIQGNSQFDDMTMLCFKWKQP